MKSQLHFASHMLDDATAALRHAEKAAPKDAAMWQGFAEMNIQSAVQRRQKVQETVDMYGGPDSIIEFGG